VRSVVCALVGDEAGARDVELVLPETGVCQTDLGASSCCGGADEASGTSCGTDTSTGTGTGTSSCGAPAVNEAQTVHDSSDEIEEAGELVGAGAASTSGACCR
jgi:hypothetical protein